MEISGKIKLINDTQTFDSGFRKRELIVTTEEQYPQHISVEFLQDKVDLLNDYSVGDSIKIGINLRGREWTNPEGVAKYFNSIVGWRIEKLGQNAPATPNVKPDNNLSNDSEEDDLPF